MVTIDGISGEAAADVESGLKSEVETATPLSEGQAVEPTKSQDQQSAAGTEAATPGDDLKVELAKRFGEGKSDQELLEAVWQSYRNGEKTFSQATAQVKELEGLVNQFGGVDVLKQALTQSVAQPAAPHQPQFPERVQRLIDQGYLDPNDPKDALVIDQEIRLDQANQAIGRSTYNEAVQTFENGLKGIAGKYEYADMDVIRELGFKGAFAKDTDAQMWQKIDALANKMHSKVAGLVDRQTQGKLDQLKKLNEKKPLDGQPGGGKPTTRTPRQAFDETHSQFFNE